MCKQIQTEQRRFIHRETAVLSYRGAFGMARRLPFYAKDISEADKKEIREYVYNELWNLGKEYESKEKAQDEETHIERIEQFQGDLNEKYGNLLSGGATTFGRAQKLINLYLKYMWCGAYIAEPSHCPVDGVVLQALQKRAKRHGKNEATSFSASAIPTSFTSMDKDTYTQVIEYIREVAGPSMTLGTWELHTFNDR